MFNDVNLEKTTIFLEDLEIPLSGCNLAVSEPGSGPWRVLPNSRSLQLWSQSGRLGCMIVATPHTVSELGQPFQPRMWAFQTLTSRCWGGGEVKHINTTYKPPGLSWLSTAVFRLVVHLVLHMRISTNLKWPLDMVYWRHLSSSQCSGFRFS